MRTVARVIATGGIIASALSAQVPAQGNRAGNRTPRATTTTITIGGRNGTTDWWQEGNGQGD
jgi:hypothetical protein